MLSPNVRYTLPFTRYVINICTLACNDTDIENVHFDYLHILIPTNTNLYTASI